MVNGDKSRENNKLGWRGEAWYWLFYFYYKMILDVFLSTDLSLLLFFSYVFKWLIRISCCIPFICPFGQVWPLSAYLAAIDPPGLHKASFVLGSGYSFLLMVRSGLAVAFFWRSQPLPSVSFHIATLLGCW